MNPSPVVPASLRPRPSRGFALLLLAAAVGLVPLGLAQSTATVLKTFTGRPDGDTPSSVPLLAADGLLYGLTFEGGTNNTGTVYRIRPDGTGYTVVTSFPAGVTSITNPGPLWLLGLDGAFYSATAFGGPFGGGTIFRINSGGSAPILLHAFSRGGSERLPSSALIQGADGAIYGLTSQDAGGGVGNDTLQPTAGSVFRVAPGGGGYRLLRGFAGSTSDGSNPTALILGRNGNLFGTTIDGGVNNLSPSNAAGSIFTMRTDGTGFSIIHSFSAAQNAPKAPDSPIFQASDGTIYGTTTQGGAANRGTIYRINPDGSGFRVLHSFTGGAAGDAPRGSFFQARDGMIYGVADNFALADNQNRVIYRIATDGTGFQVITPTAGVPTGGFLLTQGSDGVFYGTTASLDNRGSVFRLGAIPGGGGGGGSGVPVITQQPVSQMVAAGATATFTVTATGATAYQWRRDNVPVAGATTATLTLTNVTAAGAGAYTVLVSNGSGDVTSNPAVLTISGASTASRLMNLSILTTLSGASDSFTMGYVVGGDRTSGAKPLVIRAAGPSLSALSVATPLADPKLEIFAGATKTGENDNWGGGTDLATAMRAVGAFDYTGPASRDAAVALSTTARDNSAKVSPVGNISGTVIAEVYDATPAPAFTAATPRLINVSVLKNIGTSLSAGFVIFGTGTRTVLIRAIGPTLGAAPFGLTGVVEDPRMELFTAGTKIGENDNWGGGVALSTAFTNTGAFPLPAASRDAALLVTLAPGNYSVVVTGVGNTSGIALVEVYEVP